MAIKGSCLCGAVSYKVNGALDIMGHCHCSMCRKSNGAAFVTWGLINPDLFQWTSGEEFVQKYESSPGKMRCFCKRCGTSLGLAESGQVSEIVMGTVDGDPEMRPSAHIFVRSKAPWHEITDNLPQYEGWPPGMEP